MDWNNEEDDRLKCSTDTNLFRNQKLFYFIAVSYLQRELTSEKTHSTCVIYVAFDIMIH